MSAEENQLADAIFFVERCENALRNICITHLGFDPSEGEGTTPEEVVEMLAAKYSWLPIADAPMKKDAATLLTELLRDAKVTIRFGLVAQGHIPTIEEALKAGESWNEIGRRIGWCPKTAKEHYERYLETNR